ncbi:Mrp/NBP35 family ATP-binding protein [Natrinema caseinilyticum]|uniref:Mrp/NBP35 family ATP-binding protein n=1 Tax=Natrinema caseinilyticum TaxID=2961570 RepID=UPI0020C44CA3|nr:Mrp/NBP35 family ATP-binding protein [Natrinema caseinilyticum]
MDARHQSDELTARVRRALADAEIARDVLFTGLADLDALAVRVREQTAQVTVTLPIPSAMVRDTIARDVTHVAQDVDGVSTVECRFESEVPSFEDRVDFIPEVKNVVAVASGKGGVGKSTVAVNVASALAAAGATVGLLDADIYGPNAPTMLGLEERTPDATLDDQIVPREAHGVRVMSMDFIVEEDDPVIWRGPLVDEFIKQLFSDVEWGDLDYLFVDLPPGTGDAQLSLVQHLPVTGAVIVTTPEPVAVDDARRGLQGFARYGVPVLGIAENMASFECPDCESEHDIFDAGGGEGLAAEFDIPVLGELPVDPAVGTLDPDTDEGTPGVSIPGIGRLQLPRMREERERSSSLPPIAVRDGGGDSRAAMERLATRTAARINSLAV